MPCVSLVISFDRAVKLTLSLFFLFNCLLQFFITRLQLFCFILSVVNPIYSEGLFNRLITVGQTVFSVKNLCSLVIVDTLLEILPLRFPNFTKFTSCSSYSFNSLFNLKYIFFYDSIIIHQVIFFYKNKFLNFLLVSLLFFIFSFPRSQVLQ